MGDAKPEAEKQYSLTDQEIFLIGESLSDLPYKKVSELIKKLSDQYAAQHPQQATQQHG
jgi:2-hydroxy-3-keto-5-methylthiopentenyl-1-phosphate phosphatase